MQPNFQNSQYLVIDELTYRLHMPARGDVMVFHYPRDTQEYFIKRVIGLPGERVVITNGEVMIYNSANPQGMVLNESAYLPAGTTTTTDVDVTLGAGNYFVLGDNRAASFDSRFWGPVPQADIVGRVVFRAYPFNVITDFGHLTYPSAANPS
jgi:signal peptidase I